MDLGERRETGRSEEGEEVSVIIRQRDGGMMNHPKKGAVARDSPLPAEEALFLFSPLLFNSFIFFFLCQKILFILI